MKTIDKVVACVVDHGRFVHVAQRLARDFEKVYYFSPFERDCPTIREGLIGDGFDEITRCLDPLDIKQECDLFVFPDIGFAPLQNELISQGYPVWGPRKADELEFLRGKFLSVLQKLDMNIPPFEVVQGLTQLREHLKDKEDKYVKMSRWRGDWETLHWRSWDQDEGVLDYYAFKFGPAKDLPKFYVFDSIDTHIEDGIDTHCIDGKLPTVALHGMERKDKSYIGTMVNTEKVSEIVRSVSERFAPILSDYGYRSLFSIEVRITKDNEPYFIDPTLRAGSPPSQVEEELFGNYGEMVWRGAHGECVDPEPTANFGVQALVVSENEDEQCWEELTMPTELEQWLKVSFACKINGKVCVPPAQGKTVAWLTATGDTIKNAIDTIKDHSEKIPDGWTCDTSSLGTLLTEIEEAEKQGMPFTDQPVPKPEVVVQ